MDPLNNWMNCVDRMSQKTDANGNPQSWMTRNVATRAATLFVGVPLELAAVAQNIIRAPIEAVGVVGKLAVKAARVVSSAEFLRKAEDALPTFQQLVKTVARIVAYVVGTVFTATLGVISPARNFKLHCDVPYLNLATNHRAQNLAAELQAQQLRKAEEELAAAEEDEKQQEALIAAVADLLESHQAAADAKELARDAEAFAEAQDAAFEDKIEAQGPVLFATEVDADDAARVTSAQFSEEFKDLDDLEFEESVSKEQNWFSRWLGFKSKPVVQEEEIEVPAEAAATV